MKRIGCPLSSLFRILLFFLGLFFLLGLLGIGAIFFFGSSKLSHPVEGCGVVFGAAVWKKDIPSQALYDRTITAINLYKKGMISCLIFSGGPSKYGHHEVEVMKRLAISHHVPLKDIYLDFNGINTFLTLLHLQTHFQEKKPFVFISNDFHLARIALIAHKLHLKPFFLHASTYTSGNYQHQTYFFFREVLGFLFYLLFFWDFFLPS